MLPVDMRMLRGGVNRFVDLDGVVLPDRLLPILLDERTLVRPLLLGRLRPNACSCSASPICACCDASAARSCSSVVASCTNSSATPQCTHTSNGEIGQTASSRSGHHPKLAITPRLVQCFQLLHSAMLASQHVSPHLAVLCSAHHCIAEQCMQQLVTAPATLKAHHQPSGKMSYLQHLGIALL